MSRVVNKPEEFTIIGENIHTTRSVRRDGTRVVALDGGVEAVSYKDERGNQAYLRIPERFKSTQPYQQGQVKHFMIAASKGINGDAAEQAEGAAYVRAEVLRQVAAGARFLDLNVDEISYKLDLQKKAMEWMVRVAQEISTVPLSVDSSNQDIIAVGLAAYDGRAGRPMINSVALERLDTIDLVTHYDARAIVTASGASGMPNDDAERVANVSQLIEEVRRRDVPLSDVYVDALVFPISVAAQYGLHYLDAVKELRNRFGNHIHITGGLSNVSFGLPNRKLVNDTFIHLGLEAGIDSGIIDPVQSNIAKVLALDTGSESVQLAADMLLGKDEFCVNYIKAWKDGRLNQG
ncbi:MAG: hypothetical protein FJ312_08010 [SAR202 cluster bacterium]|nr:hypothetical protein [SAR202 cluster bacterium]